MNKTRCGVNCIELSWKRQGIHTEFRWENLPENIHFKRPRGRSIKMGVREIRFAVATLLFEPVCLYTFSTELMAWLRIVTNGGQWY
jgi:hypothetical protein